jgi:hypothetical protein
VAQGVGRGPVGEAEGGPGLAHHPADHLAVQRPAAGASEQRLFE